MTLINSLVPSQKVARARRIRESNIVEFSIIDHQPLIAYCRIQGTAADPYIVIISLDQKILVHSCPDFNKGYGWCKHIAKLLLLLPDKDVEQVANHRNELKVHKYDCKRFLKEVKTAQITRNPFALELSLDDRIEAFCTINRTTTPSTSQINSIRTFIANEILKLPPQLSLVRAQEILVQVPNTQKEYFVTTFGDIFIKMLENGVSRLLKDIWVTRIETLLLNAHLLGSLSEILTIPINLPSIQMPSSISQEERIYLRIMFESLCRNKMNKHQLVKLPEVLQFHACDLEPFFVRIKQKLSLAAITYTPLMEWLQTKAAVSNQSQITYPENIDDFLIYLVKCTGDRPKYHVKINSFRGYGFISEKILTRFPVLQYIFTHIRESGRNYLTEREFQHHSKFFQWLKGDPLIIDWVESVRDSTLDILIPDRGVIIQWDINACYFDQPFLEAFNGEQRIIIDPSSPLYSSIQPFDYTLCNFPFLNRPNRTALAYPTHLLTPNQVYTRVKSGVRIISSLLPWNLISDFAQGQALQGAAIASGIQQCINRNFVYGWLILKDKLDSLYLMAEKGVSEKQYNTAHKKLMDSTHRLNQDTRVVCRALFIGEGRILQKLIDFLHWEKEDQWLRLVLKSAIKSETLDSFRISMVTFILTELIQKRLLKLSHLRQLRQIKIGPYSIVPEILASRLETEIKRTSLLLKTYNSRNIKQFKQSLIGSLLLKETKLINNTKIGESDWNDLQLLFSSYIKGN